MRVMRPAFTKAAEAKCLCPTCPYVYISYIQTLLPGPSVGLNQNFLEAELPSAI